MFMMGDDKKKKMPSIIVSMIKGKGSDHDEAGETSDEEAGEFSRDELDEGEALMQDFEDASTSRDKVIAMVQFLEWFDRTGHLDAEKPKDMDRNENLLGPE